MHFNKVTHIVFYRPYRAPSDSALDVVMFSDSREAMSFEASHRRYCSSMELCKVDFELTEDILKQIVQAR